MATLLRHRQTKGAATDRLGLRDAESCSLLYPIFREYVRKQRLPPPSIVSEMVLSHSLSSATYAGAIILTRASVDRSFWWA